MNTPFTASEGSQSSRSYLAPDAGPPQVMRTNPEGTAIASEEDLKAAIRAQYARAATGTGCCGPSSAGGAATCGAGATAARSVAAEADLGLGCGHPTALGEILPGSVVLDLGSGAGVDCFLAAEAVGPAGRVIGVDMTPEMVARARRHAASAGLANVEFRLGEIEHVPLADASVDIVLSNCVINLAPDKRAVFDEIRRVLKPGGRAYLSDISLTAPLPAEIRQDPQAVASCVGGAIQVEEYRALVRAVGLELERFEVRGGAGDEDDVCCGPTGALPLVSVDVVARKP
jgi:SAM-dependent methyltransferase